MRVIVIILFCLHSFLSYAEIRDSIPGTDSSVNRGIIYSWRLEGLTNNIIDNKIDTTINDFQSYNPVYRKYFSASYPGNIGFAFKSNVYYLEDQHSDVPFFHYYRDYCYSEQNQEYFNTKRRYSDVYYTNGGQKLLKEQILKVLHTQNITPNWNAGVKYDNYSSVGQYKNQTTRLNFISIFSSYQSERYVVHGAANFNKIRNMENGGLINDSDYEESIYKTTAIPVYFGGTVVPKTLVKNKNFFLDQKLRFGRSYDIPVNDSVTKKGLDKFLEIGLTSKYSDFRRIYEDKNPLSGKYHGLWVDDYSPILSDSIVAQQYYGNGTVYFDSLIPILIDSISTFDSVFLRKIENVAYFGPGEDFLPNINITGALALGNEIQKVSYRALWDPKGNDVLIKTYGYTDTILNSTFLQLYLHSKRDTNWSWRLSYKNYRSGFKTGDFSFNGGLAKSIRSKKDTSAIVLKIDFDRAAPGFFEQHYFSNHYTWDSTFLKKDVTSVELYYLKPSWKLKAGIHVGILDNYLYYEPDGIPRQETSTFDVYSYYIDKDFYLWKLVVKNRFVYQDVGNMRIMRLPEFAYMNSTYIDHVFHFKSTGGSLHSQFGFEVYYFSKYKGYAYNPLLSQFVLQDEKVIGGKPYITAFMNFKLKSARFFFIGENLQSLFTSRDYYSVVHYPMNEFAFKFGLSWRFYD